jgi:uncharacterized protein (TIGR00159 family)
MQFIGILENLRFVDILDVLFLSVVAYHLYIWFQGTKAFKALVGLLLLGVVYTAARTWGLFLTTWFFQVLWQVLVILLIILFQNEIRQALERVNPLQTLGLRRTARSQDWIPEFCRTVFSLARSGIGALIVLERDEKVKEWITGGIPVEGPPGQELLFSIFQKESPLHDGAVLLRNGQVTDAACYLPLSPDEGLPKEWGTRHRAALGLSQRCDAWVVVVSEERGEVSLARAGEIVRMEKEENLAQEIAVAMSPPHSHRSPWVVIRSLITHRWRLKLGTFALVSLVWLLLAGQQDFEVSFSVPLKVKNLPAHLVATEPVDPKVRITVRGLRKDASLLGPHNVLAEMDLSAAVPGQRIFPVRREFIHLPNDRVQVVRVEPASMEFRFQKKGP